MSGCHDSNAGWCNHGRNRQIELCYFCELELKIRVQSEEIYELNDRVKDIEYRLNHIVKFPTEVDIRLQEVERILDKLTDKPIKKPHICPRCRGFGIIWG